LNSKVLFTLKRSRAERSKDHNKVTAGTTKLQRSNAVQKVLIFFTGHTINELKLKFCSTMLLLKCERDWNMANEIGGGKWGDWGWQMKASFVIDTKSSHSLHEIRLT